MLEAEYFLYQEELVDGIARPANIPSEDNNDWQTMFNLPVTAGADVSGLTNEGYYTVYQRTGVGQFTKLGAFSTADRQTGSRLGAELAFAKTGDLYKLFVKEQGNGTLGNNGKLSNNDISNIQLPYIFGSPEINEVVELKKIIDQSNIVYSQIESLYYFKSNRWDLKFTNNLLIKLPENINKKALDKISFFLKNIELENKKILDARIKNQIIILNE